MPVGKVRIFDDAPDTRRDPLGHWLQQEREAQLPDDHQNAEGMPATLPSGWWLLPVILLALPLWGVLIRAALAG